MFTPYRDDICMVARDGSLLVYSTNRTTTYDRNIYDVLYS